MSGPTNRPDAITKPLSDRVARKERVLLCHVEGCERPINEKRIRRYGASRIKTCSSACSHRLQLQTQAERQRRSIERRERQWKEKHHEA